MGKTVEQLQAELDDLWARYDLARRTGQFDACWKIIPKYRKALLALDAHRKDVR